ncbi:MAG TPA: cation:dicarboxylase symporter family transporter [Gammaproteobacteria bacterium]|nr:cation:dicarboxylase symporter family transporter [Gammaproteobacteria bacterium]HIL98110.1 cation:dicarboxylase symporter family transporter [Pseudomonadales bacterium]
MAAFTDRDSSSMTLSTKILIGLSLGLLCGIIFGEVMTQVAIVGEAFLMLLQMTVLPYIVVSVIYGVGSLNPASLRVIVRYGIIGLGLFWGATLFFIMLVPLTFPVWESANYYTPELLGPQPEHNFLATFVPANLFRSLVEPAVPAVVVFSGIFGYALMEVKGKQKLLETLEVIQGTIGNVAMLVLKLAPFGVFAIGANAAATIQLEELQGVYVFVTTVAVTAFFLCFWVFPRMLVSVSPFSYGEIIAVSRDALLTAFITGNFFVVLPILSEQIKKLLELKAGGKSDSEYIVDIIVPISYSLPTAGKLLGLIFVLFAGWFSGESLDADELPLLFLSGLMNLFGSAVIALPALLDMFSIPANLFQLYQVTDHIIINRLSTMLASMFCVCFALFVSAGSAGWLKPRFWKIGKYTGIAAALAFVLIVGLRTIFSGIGHHYEGYTHFIDRELISHTVNVKVLQEPASTFSEFEIQPVLQRVKERGVFRVGYYRDWLPYAFHNEKGDLVGFDVELAHLLARDLGVELEFVRIYRNQTAPLLQSGYLDMASGVAMTPERMKIMTLSSPYVEEVMAFVVERERRKTFRTWEQLRDVDDLVVGIPDAYYDVAHLRDLLPDATVWEIATPRLFFRDKDRKFNTMMFGIVGASAWTLLYPEYVVVAPKPEQLRVPLAFPLAANDVEFELYMRNWIELRRRDDTIHGLFRYWMRGEDPSGEPPTRSLWEDLIEVDIVEP